MTHLTFEQLGILITIGTSVVALVFSGLAFSRGRNIDLQNHLFMKKLEAYESIIGEFQNILKLLHSVSAKINSFEFSNLPIDKIEELNSLADKIDLEVDKSRNEIAKSSACFSKEFIERILIKIDTLYGEIDKNLLEDKLKLEGAMETYIQSQANSFEILINEMRSELALDHFNQKLLNRAKKGSFRLDI